MAQKPEEILEVYGYAVHAMLNLKDKHRARHEALQVIIDARRVLRRWDPNHPDPWLDPSRPEGRQLRVAVAADILEAASAHLLAELLPDGGNVLALPVYDGSADAPV